MNILVAVITIRGDRFEKDTLGRRSDVGQLVAFRAGDPGVPAGKGELTFVVIKGGGFPGGGRMAGGASEATHLDCELAFVNICMAGTAAEIRKSERHSRIDTIGLRRPVTGVTICCSMSSCQREAALIMIASGEIRRTKAGNGMA
jgi:hypothetical protein